MRLPQGFEWLVIGAIVLLLFGAKRMPDAARGLGRSLRIFKAETKGLADDTDDVLAGGGPTPSETAQLTVSPSIHPNNSDSASSDRTPALGQKD